MNLSPEHQAILARAESAEAQVKVLVEELERLRANQRTPGMTEVCENHVYKECRNHGGAMRFEPCQVKPCPIRTAKEPQA